MKKITRISLSLIMLALFAAGGCRDEPPIDPRTGAAFTSVELGKLARFAEECEDNGKLSKQSLNVLVKHHGFTRKQRKQLKNMCADRLALIERITIESRKDQAGRDVDRRGMNYKDRRRIERLEETLDMHGMHGAP